MEYLSQVIPLPTSKDNPTIREGEVGILNYKRDFLIVYYLSCDSEEERATYRILAKCADKFLAHKIREACEYQLEMEYVTEVERARVRAEEEMEKKEWDCSCKPAEYGIKYCVDDSCPYLSACPNYLP
jgi:hypothetical protein